MQRKATLILAIVAVMLFSGVSADTSGNEANYIRKLFTALGISFDANADVCTYSGIECAVGRNVEGQTSYAINLYQRGLSATFIPELDDGVSGLDIYTIDLSGNRGIKARVPNSWGRLSYLETLDLSGCRFYGAIPDAWNANMVHLRELNLKDNSFCYSIPNWAVTNFPLIEKMDFSQNQLRYFSSAFGTFSLSTTLTTLSFKNNKMCGCKPDTWTSQLLVNAAIGAKSDSTSTKCNGKDCSSGDQCKPDGVLHAARTSLLSVFAAVLLVVFLAL